MDGPAGFVDTLRLGSRLELTGVYDAGEGNYSPGQDVTPFDLLLNSSADIKILAQPPWWTLERLLVVVGALVCGLTAAALWISQLRRQVDERTAQLEVQIKERQRARSQRAMEQERARVAQDLHDELVLRPHGDQHARLPRQAPRVHLRRKSAPARPPRPRWATAPANWSARSTRSSGP